ncbi:MAG: hypothetical protein NTX45_00300 [Proteobacteria bacterium]|nr:hypothetical protein [Pseudomonadota bacterium]
MTICLAKIEDDGIYVAAERCGIPNQQSLNRKIIKIQNSPEVIILISGGLYHWALVVKEYPNQIQPTLNHAVERIAELLKQRTELHNDNHALVCGYENKTPKIYRIDKFESKHMEEPQQTKGYYIEPLGEPNLARLAAQVAHELYASGHPLSEALVEGITSQNDPNFVVLPVDLEILRPPQ